MAKGEKFLAHSNYGTGYEGNYIEAHIMVMCAYLEI